MSDFKLTKREKKCFSILGVVAIAAVIICSARNNANSISVLVATKLKPIDIHSVVGEVRHGEYNLNAGVSRVLAECIPEYVEPQLSPKDIQFVEAAAPYDANMSFQEFVQNFYDWCTSTEYLSIDFVHSFSMNESDYTIQEIHSQTATADKWSHVVANKPDYAVNMWFNKTTSDYYVQFTSEDFATGWVYETSTNYNTQSFLESLMNYQTSTSTVNNILNFIIEENVEVIEGVKEGSYTATVTSGEDKPYDFNATFGKDAVKDWNVSMQKVDNFLYIDIVCEYDQHEVSKEVWSYVITPNVTSNMDKPAVVDEQRDTENNLSTIYDFIKE